MRPFINWLCAVLVAAVVVFSPQVVRAQWSDLGLNGREVRRVRSGDGSLYACTNDGVHRKVSTTADSAWVLLGFAGERVHDLVALSAETLIVARNVTGTGADTVALWRSTNGGSSWTPFQNGFGAGGPSFDRRVVALLEPPFAPGIILAANLIGHIGKSTDGGETWERVFWGPTYSFRFLTAGSSTAWAGGESGIETPILRRSTDGAETWAPTGVPVYSVPSSADAMAFDPADPIHAILRAGPLLETSDNGASWGLIPSPEDGSGAALATRRFPPLRVYVNGLPSQGSKVWITDNLGATWSEISLAGTAHGSVLAILVHSGPAADTLFLGMANGFLRYIETEVVGVERLSLSSRLELHAYPSPSRGLTTVSFSLPQAGPASLRVLDSAGREVAMLLDGEQPAGQHGLLWKAPQLPSGGYFIQLRAAGAVVTRKVFLVQ